MLRVDLGRLRREGSVLVEALVPPQHELWQDFELTWAGDVAVRLTASSAGTGELVVRGRVEGELAQECRRCLQPVTQPFSGDITMVVETEPSGEEDDGEVYVVEPDGSELDVSRAVREELILAINPYVVCDPECRGLCVHCGTNLNEGSCHCSHDEVDPRWEALRTLKEK